MFIYIYIYLQGFFKYMIEVIAFKHCERLCILTYLYFSVYAQERQEVQWTSWRHRRARESTGLSKTQESTREHEEVEKMYKIMYNKNVEVLTHSNHFIANL